MENGCCKANKYLRTRTRSQASKLHLPAVFAAEISTAFTNSSSNTNLDYNT
jgi:hypothetical protein